MTETSPRGDPKPRLVFFQWDHRPNAGASSFLALHMQHHVKCLAHYFNVTVIAEDSDYDAVCDTLAPDLVLFEAGYRTHGSRRIRIDRTGTHPQVPKLALHNGDPWCDRRAGLLADMETWGIETVFAIGTATPGYMPTMAERMFVWPNFIDPETFCDRGLEKVVPVTLTGQAYGLYPWRQAVHEMLAAQYPCLVTPPFRYEDGAARRMLAGESYSRALNASFVSPACGTMGHELVRKHLEIPGSGCLLLAERTPVLEAAGFVDSESCVFAEPGEVLAKLDSLFADPERMQAITRAGHALVHARHTLAHRPQIREWFELNRLLGSDERIIQPGPFAPLEIAPATARQGHVLATGLDRAALARAARHLSAGDAARARAAYEAALSYVAYLPEARLGLALCDLAEGKAAPALGRLACLIETTLAEYGARRPDPLEWALYLAALLAAGRKHDAIALRRCYPEADHAELRHIRATLCRMAGEAPATPAEAPRGASLHLWPERDEAAHLAWLDDLLRRCGQPTLAGMPAVRRPRLTGLTLLDTVLGRIAHGALRPPVPAAPGMRYLTHLRDSIGRRLLPPAWRPAARRIVALRPTLRHRVTGRRHT